MSCCRTDFVALKWMKRALISGVLAVTVLQASSGSTGVNSLGFETPELTKMPQWQIALKGGTLGVGLDVTHPFSSHWAMRFNINGFIYRKNFGINKYLNADIGGIETSGGADLFSMGLLVDWHPFQNPVIPFINAFYMSAGAYYNGNRFTTSSSITSKSFQIDGIRFDAKTINAITGEMTFNHLNPYAGIGYSAIDQAGWGFSWDMGIMYHGAPTYQSYVIRSKNSSEKQQDVYDAVKRVDARVNDELGDWWMMRFYPVVRMGIRYNF